MVGNLTHSYNKSFFDNMQDGALRSASIVLPVVIDLLGPRSVVDIGCGRGAWLRVAMNLGVENTLGLDGSYVLSEGLLIPREHFRPTDLSRPFPAPQGYDLAICLEVAEHLPRRTANSLVANLTSAAPAVLFSAAIPGQTGTHHINEQFPWYWRDLFARHNFVALDAVRPRIRENHGVEPWYAQNALLYVSRDYYQRTPHLREYHPVESREELLPWVCGATWYGRANWRGPFSMLKMLFQDAVSPLRR